MIVNHSLLTLSELSCLNLNRPKWLSQYQDDRQCVSANDEAFQWVWSSSLECVEFHDHRVKTINNRLHL